MITLEHCMNLDLNDPLRALRDQFVIPEGLVYLDGNSLGMLPKTTSTRLQKVIEFEWGQGLIGSWNSAGWYTMPGQIAERLAPILGALPQEVMVADSTSLNLYKVLAMAMQQMRRPNSSKRVVLTEADNFPTDLYMMQSLCQQWDFEWKAVPTADLGKHLNANVAILMLSHVNYRTGHMHDMQVWNERAHNFGARTLWDLAHSAGAVPLQLNASNSDYAVGCGYKYLNGGPGAPAYVWVHSRWHSQLSQPLSGWFGHIRPFEFDGQYQPAADMRAFLCGTPPILSMVALACGIETVRSSDALGGMTAIREKSLQLSQLFMELVQQRLQPWGLECVTPLATENRGSHVSLTAPEGSYAMIQALITHGVVGDYRAGRSNEPHLLRFGFTPLTLRYIDVWEAVDRFEHVLKNDVWRDPRFSQTQAVT